MRFPRSSLWAVVLSAALVAAPLSAPARAAEVEVRWKTASGTSIPQGLPLRYEARVTNPGDRAITLSMTFELHPEADPLDAVPFDRWTGSVAGGSSIRVTGRVTPAQWFPQRGRFLVSVRSSLDIPALAFRVTEPPGTLPVFDDVTAEVGLQTTHRASIVCDNYSAGAAWGDVEGDGDVDLYLPHQDGPPQMWLNEEGTFREVAAERGLAGEDVGLAAVFGDYDNDGDQDLY
nr:VCBS repeat-containing protein [Actinomycetota bacterium]